MASSLQRIGKHGRTLIGPLYRSFTSSADALVDYKPGEIGLVSGIPDEHLTRRVVIYSPARTASQQGSGRVGRWKINFVSTQKWENPLMGWTSTGDPYANVGDSALTFDSEEAAKSFAERHGWEYVIEGTRLPSALSAASSACDHIRDWVLGTPVGTWVSMGVYSDGSYNVPTGLIYSFPVTCQNGEWKIVQGLSIDEYSRKKLDLTANELSEEKALAYSCLN